MLQKTFSVFLGSQFQLLSFPKREC